MRKYMVFFQFHPDPETPSTPSLQIQAPFLMHKILLYNGRACDSCEEDTIWSESKTTTHVLPSTHMFQLLPVFSAGSVGARLAKVDPQPPAVDFLVLKVLLRGFSAGDIDEVGVGETSGLAGTSVDGDSDVENIPDVAEEVVEVFVGHLEGHVANEERLGGLLGGARGTGRDAGLAADVVLHGQATALEDLLVERLQGGGGVLYSVELDVAETVHVVSLHSLQTM